MKFDIAIPVLYAKDVSRSIAYFIGQLKFDDNWQWDNPATFGCARKDSVEIFFAKSTHEIPVTWIAIVVDNVDEYYELIKDKGAKIISEPASKEGGMREMVVECPDGHMIRIGHHTTHTMNLIDEDR